MKLNAIVHRGSKMKADLVEKLRKEQRFYLLRKEDILEQVEKKRIEIIDMEYRLATLKKDLALSEEMLKLMRENGL